jgi:hypothetical protein
VGLGCSCGKAHAKPWVYSQHWRRGRKEKGKANVSVKCPAQASLLYCLTSYLPLFTITAADFVANFLVPELAKV